MRIYLDLCVYNRPFDYQGQERVGLETEAFIFLLEYVEKGIYTLVNSAALIYENNLNPDLQRRDRISTYLQLAKEYISGEDFDFERAIVLRRRGFSDMDALHIALSEKGQVDFFITCDDRIVNLYKKNIQSINVKVISLLEFVSKGGEMR
ncbi:MAG: PIN domain-containing protein [Thermodesulfobacteriota bacterium]|nr:PIN domain-containing protein [Thermodesulfobacteriota bacterium]